MPRPPTPDPAGEGIGVKLVANSLGHLCLSKILLNNARLSLFHLLLLLCLCGRERFILLFLDLLDISNHKPFSLFLVAYSMIIKVMLSIREM